MTTKPPLGIMPCNIWKERRFLELAATLGRQAEYLATLQAYTSARRECLCNMKEWAKEMIDLEIQP